MQEHSSTPAHQLDLFSPPPFDPNPPFLRGKFRLRHPMVPGKRWCAEEISTGRFLDCGSVLKILATMDDA